MDTEFLKKEYAILIHEYRKKFDELKKAERKHEDDKIIRFIDKERNEIHNQLRAVAVKIGKSPQDITLDILASENNLAEYQLPEFKIFRPNNIAFFNITSIKYKDDKGKKHKLQSLEDKSEFGNFIENTGFISFGQQEWYHLFDEEGYPFRQPEELEYRRRIQKISELTGGKAFLTELHSQDTFHRATTMYGIGFDPKYIDQLLAILYQNRTEVSIDKKFLNIKQIEADVIKMLEEDIEYILAFKTNEYQTHSYLLETLQRHYRFFYKNYYAGKILSEKFLKEFDSIIEDKIKLVKKEEESNELDKMIENELEPFDESEKDFPKEAGLPKFEPTKRR